MFILLWKIQIYNVNAMFKTKEGVIAVKTFMPFNTINCDDTEPITINEFKDGSFVKGNKRWFPPKMKNLFGCPVRVAISNNVQPTIIVKNLSNESVDLSGRDISLISVLAELMNFNINYTYIGRIGHFLENGSAEGTLRTIMDGNADLSLSNWALKENRLKFLSGSTSYSSEQIIFVVPPGREFTPLEILIFPLSSPVWILIASILIVGTIVITVIRFRFKNLHDFIFGDGVKTPFLNMIIGFLGEVQNILPKRNFPRLLLMMFLLYSLVIRTVYQGSFYRLLKSEKRHREVKSVDEIIAGKFKIYTYIGMADVFQQDDTIQSR